MRTHRSSLPDGCDHRPDNSWPLLDYNGVVLTRYCKNCEDEKRRAFNLRSVHKVRTEEYEREDGYE